MCLRNCETWFDPSWICFAFYNTMETKHYKAYKASLQVEEDNFYRAPKIFDNKDAFLMRHFKAK